MRVRAAVVLASALLAAGCLAPAVDDRGEPDLDALGEEAPASPRPGMDEAPMVGTADAEPMPVRPNAPLLLGCRALYIIDHASAWLPPAEWIPPGYRLSSIGGDSTASYELKVVACPALALDNQTLLHGVAFAYLTAILEAGPQAEGALPSHNLLLIDAYVDHADLAAAFATAGLAPPAQATIRITEVPGGTRVDIQHDGEALVQAVVQTNETYGALADRVKAERIHLLPAEEVHQWWDVSYVHDQVNLSTFGSISILGGRAATLAPAGSFTLQGNGLDHRDVRGELLLAP